MNVRATACFASTLVFALAHAASAEAASFGKGPYLQALGATSVEVRVELDAPAGASVEIAQPGKPTRTVADTAARDMHVLRIDGLEPQTRYEYSVKIDGGPTSSKGTFVTAPRDDSGAPFTFVIYGDTRSDDATHRLVARAVAAAPADFLLNTGDFVYRGGDRAEWASFFDAEATLLRDRCVFACVGNHELYTDEAGAAFERYFGPIDGKLYSTFRWSNARFFMLNAFTRWDGGEEREWLTRELEKADAEAGLAWRIAVIHFGPFSAGRHGSNKELDAARIPELLAAHKIDLVVSGHDHMYERGEAKTPSFDLRYVVSGGGGAPLYREIHPLPSTRKAEAAYHAVEVSVTSETIAMTARRADGSLLDKCSFGHAPGWSCDPGAVPAAATTTARAAAASTAPSARVAGVAPEPSQEASKCGCRTVGAPSGMTWGWVSSALLALKLRRRRRKKARA